MDADEQCPCWLRYCCQTTRCSLRAGHSGAHIGDTDDDWAGEVYPREPDSGEPEDSIPYSIHWKTHDAP